MGINTGNFYKFICTISLALMVYCFSFDTVFLEPYNAKAAELNIQKAELCAEDGYLRGKLLDLTIPHIENLKTVEYFMFNHEKDTSEVAKYYSSSGLSDSLRIIIDSVNIMYRAYAKSHFKYDAILEYSKALKRNTKVMQWILSILGVCSLIAFIFSLSLWYNKRDIIDK